MRRCTKYPRNFNERSTRARLDSHLIGSVISSKSKVCEKLRWMLRGTFGANQPNQRSIPRLFADFLGKCQSCFPLKKSNRQSQDFPTPPRASTTERRRLRYVGSENKSAPRHRKVESGNAAFTATLRPPAIRRRSLHHFLAVSRSRSKRMTHVQRVSAREMRFDKRARSNGATTLRIKERSAA